MERKKLERKKLEIAGVAALAAVFAAGSAFISTDAYAAEKRNKPRSGQEVLSQTDSFDFEDGKTRNGLTKAAEKLPSSYDLRHVPTGDGGEVSYVTPVKLQNPFGTCWGFSVIATAETSLLSSGIAAKAGYDETTLDLSEKQMAYFGYTYIDDPENSQYGEGVHFTDITKQKEKTSAYKYDLGGLTQFATSVLASGTGPVLDKKYDPETGELVETQYAYKGARGERAYWEAATQYDDEGNPVEDSYQSVPVWYSNQDDWSLSEDLRFGQDFILKDSLVLPNPAGYDNMGEYYLNQSGVDAIKQQISSYHRAVSISFCAESYLPGQDTSGKKYMSDNWAHFTNTYQNSNHSVCIVGYDDNYPRENFSSTTAEGGNAMPEGNGAFLIKNSWGSELNEFPNNGYRHWGLLDGMDKVPYDPEAKANSGNRASGYFWISYYDRSLSDPETFIFEEEKKDTFYLEQMDLMNAPYCLFDVIDDSRTANVFTAEATSRLSDLSVMTTAPGTTVSYEIYLLGEDFEDPEDGILVTSGEEYFDYGGYHRFSIPETGVLAKGQMYSVVISLICEDLTYYCYMADVNIVGSDMYTVGVINEGESFFYDGEDWKDLSDKDTQKEVYSYYAPQVELVLDNFPIKSYLEPVTYMDGENEEQFLGYLSINNWQDGNVGSYSLSVDETKALTAEFRGTSGNMPASWNPVFNWEVEDEDILSVTTSTPQKSKARITGKKGGVTRLIIYAGDKNGKSYLGKYPDNYGVRVLTIVVENPVVSSFELKDKDFIGYYTGAPIEPEVEQVCGLRADGQIVELVNGRDYEVSYENNIEIGTAMVNVTGIGEYEGCISAEFQILEAPKNCWKSMDGKWYYFDKTALVEKDAYRNGYYLDENGIWNGKDTGPGWTKVGNVWRYSTSKKTWLKSEWKKIDGNRYYFKADGYAAQNEFIKGKWFGKNCLQTDTKKYSWHKTARGWWYGMAGGWYAKNTSYVIDGVKYHFDARGYCTNP